MVYLSITHYHNQGTTPMSFYDDPDAWVNRNIIIDPDGVRRCLACSDGDHQTCYGTSCDCDCEGEQV
jgi:hypothetical protein